MSKPYFMGIDIGTFESKGVLTDAQGAIIAYRACPHQMESPQPGYAEHDAEGTWWHDLCELSRGLIAESKVDPREIVSLGVSGIAPCCLPVDENLRPLRKAILYGIDVRAVTLSDTVEFGILRLIVSDPVKAEEVLRAHHFTVSITEVLCVRVDDVPGGLNAVVQLLQKEGISLEYLYAYISKSVDASVIFYVKDCARAEEVLRKNGIRLLSEAY